ncbi:hypothetical protein [Streptomyces agglomeratus]|uniref:hypothetical protein n=1 Tax=Streptomyces agglomeratus TaxID=285458 RepID=UPI00114CC5DF|nr:hypothetical protein [Streptomyces agglomeratus]
MAAVLGLNGRVALRDAPEQCRDAYREDTGPDREAAEERRSLRKQIAGENPELLAYSPTV